ncbi:MAG: hypothetical protein SP4CHLAM5_00530 [Chlamydiia bacterium]|nr:hypothetical protein [Chlamydiia bacterium]MCH9617930.1 hypothetical protein [Chlamydiia bacterium]MCH9624146.1 hypothetical protein [Chlamydiia bacterium]
MSSTVNRNSTATDNPEGRSKDFRLQGFKLKYRDTIQKLFIELHRKTALKRKEKERKGFLAQRKEAKKIRLALRKKAKQAAKIQSVMRRYLAVTKLQKLQIDKLPGEQETKGKEEEKLQKVDESKKELEAQRNKLEAEEKAKVEAEAKAAAQAEKKAAKRARAKAARKAKQAAKRAAAAQAKEGGGGGSKVSRPQPSTPLEKEQQDKRLLQIASTEKFRKKVYEEGLKNKDFDKEQKDFLKHIFMSKLPMFPQLISPYTLKCYKLIILLMKKGGDFDKIKALLTENEGVSGNLGGKICKVYTFIEQLLQEATSTETLPPSLAYQEIKPIYMKMLDTIHKLSENVLSINKATNTTSEHHIPAMEKLVTWEKTLNSEARTYRLKISSSIKRLKKQRVLTDQSLSEVLQKLLPLPGTISYKMLTEVLSLNPKEQGIIQARSAIFNDDMKKGGLYHNILQAISPIIVDLGSIEEFTKIWTEKVYLQTSDLPPFAEKIYSMLQEPKPFHQLLLDKLVEKEAKVDVMEDALRNTIDEAYKAGAISPYSRILSLHAILLSLKDKDSMIADCVAKKTGKIVSKALTAVLMCKLNLNQETYLNPALCDRSIEKLTKTKSYEKYRDLIIRISHIHINYIGIPLFNLRAQVVFILKAIGPLLQMEKQMKAAQT